MRHPDWKGPKQRRFSLMRLRWEWGRWCYKTNCCGEPIEEWWEWETS